MNPSALGSLNASLLAARMPQPETASPLRELTVGLARGDDSAWMQFHREFGPVIFRQLLGATRGDHDLASEALQLAYLRIARHARACEIEAMFRAWLRVVARTALSDCRRRRMSFWQLLKARAADPAGMETVDSDLDRFETALSEALGSIDSQDRLLLESKYFSGNSVRAIAEQLNVSPKAIESRLTRAREELRRKLQTILQQHE